VAARAAGTTLAGAQPKRTAPSAAARKAPSRAQRNIDWIEKHCIVPEGALVGQPFRLREWQRDELRKIYDNPHGTRTAIISFGRKNGKTALVAALLLLHLCGPEAKVNSQLYSTAMAKEQAAVLYNLAAKMIRLSTTLSDFVRCLDSTKVLLCEQLGTMYRALSADAATAHGMSPIFAVHDELGQAPGLRHTLYDVVESGMSAHEQPLSIIISTQAPTDAALLSVLIDDALEGTDPHTVVSLYTAPEDDDPFDEETIRKANPAFGDFQNPDEIRKQAEKAKRMPSQEASYRNLILNQRVETVAPFVSREVWKQNAAPQGPRKVVYGGLDLAERGDLTALVLVGDTDPGKVGIWPTFWLPSEGIEERARNDRVPYDLWAKQGHLALTPGRAVSYAWVAEQIAELFQRFDVRRIAFDRYNMKHLRPYLVRAGLSEALIDDRFAPFGQGFYSMSPALRELETLLLESRGQHNGHPVLQMCAANAIVKMNEAGDRKLDKKRAKGRIDGMVALAMAVAAWSEAGADKPVYPVDPEDFVE
jgi:phage terminase large subunit-like protein